MIFIDIEKRQILSNSCLNCQDDFFQPPNRQFPKVGCCSYSPTFYLLEIAKMCAEDQSFFIDSVLMHPKAETFPYSIKVHAEVHPAYQQVRKVNLSKLEEDDLKLSYSTCQFFNKGCSLDPSFKNVVCRTFICMTIENSLEQEQKDSLQKWTKTFSKEELDFQLKHESELKKRGIDLIKNPQKVVQYFQGLNV
ncbi:hypothetical protein [Alkalihalobacillus deserti]|uniref:hypothetical protein n=1 Tax=Alkalihalobacillus deserti TaxID=2879466 RepID=UPI001D15CEA7|nr:hypothetical protein [Alkalihalobacillus deserti]